MKPCIHIISSRVQCIFPCLESFYDCFNRKNDYKVYIHYFDDIYSDINFQQKFHKHLSKNIEFISIPYKTPKHIKEEDLFYNRNDISYVRSSFSKSRKGYLHMCHFMSNFYGYENTKFDQHNMALSLDDESTFERELDYDPFEIMSSRSEDIGALICGQRLKNGRPHQGHRDTRIGLWEFLKGFVLKNNLRIENKILKNALLSDNGEEEMHMFPWADSYVIKLDIFKSELWKAWSQAFNKHGGIYKYRWGDNEILSLFGLMTQKHGIFNLKTVEEGYHNQGGLRHLQGYAPNIKNVNL